MWTRAESRWRDALVAAVLPCPGGGLPAAGEVDLTGFWPRFEASAPWHLRLGWRLASFALGAVLPWLLGYCRSLPSLDAEAREAVVSRAERWPLFAPLVEVAKLVTCLAYFADPEVQAIARRRT